MASNGQTNGASRYPAEKVRVAIVGVGNCANSFVQGVECKVGLATRAVRVVILSAGLVFAKGAGLGDFELLAPAIYAMTVLTGFTVLQRVFHVRSALRSAPA